MRRKMKYIFEYDTIISVNRQTAITKCRKYQRCNDGFYKCMAFKRINGRPYIFYVDVFGVCRYIEVRIKDRHSIHFELFCAPNFEEDLMLRVNTSRYKDGLFYDTTIYVTSDYLRQILEKRINSFGVFKVMRGDRFNYFELFPETVFENCTPEQRAEMEDIIFDRLKTSVKLFITRQIDYGTLSALIRRVGSLGYDVKGKIYIESRQLTRMELNGRNVLTD